MSDEIKRVLENRVSEKLLHYNKLLQNNLSQIDPMKPFLFNPLSELKIKNRIQADVSK